MLAVLEKETSVSELLIVDSRRVADRARRNRKRASECGASEIENQRSMVAGGERGKDASVASDEGQWRMAIILVAAASSTCVACRLLSLTFNCTQSPGLGPEKLDHLNTCSRYC